MNFKNKSQQLKLLTVCAAAAATVLRAAHYAFGTDGRSLLIAGHWSVIGLWVPIIVLACDSLFIWKHLHDGQFQYLSG